MGPIKGGGNAGFFSALHKINGPCGVDLFTDPGAPSAENAQVVVPVHEGVHVLQGQVLVNDGHLQVADLVFGRKGLEFTLVPVAAEDTPRRFPCLEGPRPILSRKALGGGRPGKGWCGRSA